MREFWTQNPKRSHTFHRRWSLERVLLLPQLRSSGCDDTFVRLETIQTRAHGENRKHQGYLKVAAPQDLCCLSTRSRATHAAITQTSLKWPYLSPPPHPLFSIWEPRAETLWPADTNQWKIHFLSQGQNAKSLENRIIESGGNSRVIPERGFRGLPSGSRWARCAGAPSARLCWVCACRHRFQSSCRKRWWARPWRLPADSASSWRLGKVPSEEKPTLKHRVTNVDLAGSERSSYLLTVPSKCAERRGGELVC